MQADEVRFLFAYDRWATRRVLAVLDGLTTDGRSPGELDLMNYVDEQTAGSTPSVSSVHSRVGR